jgi:hypothetical protein
MKNDRQSCVLCRKAPRRRKGSFLCQDCAKAVSQVMPYDIYEANYSEDRQAQVAQMQLLLKAAMGCG